jgi:hypothetical protein
LHVSLEEAKGRHSLSLQWLDLAFAKLNAL